MLVRQGMGSLRNALINAGMVAASVIVGAMVLEIAYRAWRAPDLLLHWPNLVSARSHRAADAWPIHDPVLGFLSKANLASPSENTDARGFRRMPPMRSGGVEEPPIVVVGDSFTYGNDVGDDETWPAYLQTMLNWRTINGGVNGYGLDQIVLRAAALASEFRPRMVVASFIGDDVRRAEFRRIWNIEKPYFEIDGDRLVLHKPPAPEATRTLTVWEAALGWSLIAERLWPALDGVDDEPFGHRVRALLRGAGERLACPLVTRLAAIGAPVLLVAQYDPRAWSGNPAAAAEQRRIADHVLACGRRAGLATLDLFDVVDAAVKAGGVNTMFGANTAHHNAAGNRLIARAIAEALRSAGLDPQRQGEGRSP
jgi:lysophospholipase L1-like esterase